MPKIVDMYITRVVNNDEKKYGFGITLENETVYIPGRVVEDFDLDENDLGTKNKCVIIQDENTEGWHVATIAIEDNLLQNRINMLQDEVDRLTQLVGEQ